MPLRLAGVNVGIAFFCLVALVSLSGKVRANYMETPEGKAFIDDMVAHHAFHRETLEKWLSGAQSQPAILDAISRPAEKTLEWSDYRRIFIKPTRIEKGRAFLAAHEDTFARAERELGVSRFIIAAIIGVETQYGDYAGRYRVMDALATLAFEYPPRASFFRKQLGEYFLMAREQSLDPATLKGSYAGAMGYGQFIPSSYRHYAIDFDGDGQADIVNNPEDAIGSVANYFAQHGWRSGDPVAEQVALADRDASLYTDGLKPKLTVADYRSAGIQPQSSVAPATRARLLRVKADEGQQDWLTYPNFYVITRYNHSHLYAMAVMELSEALADNTGERHE